MRIFYITGWLAAPFNPGNWSSTVFESTKSCIGRRLLSCSTSCKQN